MKALTLRQPWASLVAVGTKWIETRSWSTSYRGRLAVHAGRAEPSGVGWVEPYMVGRWTDYLVHADPCDCDEGEETAGNRCLRRSDWSWALLRDGGAFAPSLFARLPLGKVVATCRLVDVVPMVAAGCSTPGARLVLDEPHEGDLPYQQGGLWIIGPTALTNGHPTRVEDQRPYGDFRPGRFAWLLADVKALDIPAPTKGRRGLWEWDEAPTVTGG